MGVINGKDNIRIEFLAILFLEYIIVIHALLVKVRINAKKIIYI